MFSRAYGSCDEEEEWWHKAMRFLLDNAPDSIIVTVLIRRVDGQGGVITCDCCENCAAEMILDAAVEVEEGDGDERPGFSQEQPSHPH